MCNELKIGLVRAFNGKGKIAIVAKRSISGHEKTFQRSFLKKNQICKNFLLRPKSVSKLETRKLFLFSSFFGLIFFSTILFSCSVREKAAPLIWWRPERPYFAHQRKIGATQNGWKIVAVIGVEQALMQDVWDRYYEAISNLNTHFGGLRSTEVALLLPSRQPRVQVPAPLRFFLFTA